MKSSVLKKFLVFAFLIISINGFVGYSVHKSNEQLNISETWVAHSEQIIYKTETIFSHVKDIESASRGYIITNDSSYLSSLSNAEKAAFTSIRQLRQLILDNPPQQKRVDSLYYYILVSMDYALQTVDQRNKKGLLSTISSITENNGKNYADQIRKITNAIQQQEGNLLNQRRLANDQSINTFKLFSKSLLIVMTLLTILLLFVSGNYLLQNKGKEKRAAELIIANTELAFQNTEKGNRASELVIANKELSFQNDEKEKRAAELIIANRELHFQNGEKERRSTELIIANTDLQNAKEKIKNIGYLYDLVGKLNENIVRVKDVETLFKNSCKIVMELGKFKTAWIGIFDPENKKISLAEQSGMAAEDVSLFAHVAYQVNDSHDEVFNTGKYFISNNIQHNTKTEKWKTFGEARGIHSLMILPIKKTGKVIASLNLYSAEFIFADIDEIEILERVAEDISFALNLFENAKVQRETEELLVQKEKRFRLLIEKGMDMITLRSPAGEIYYASPSVTEVLGINNNELLSTGAHSLIHPDDLPCLVKQIEAILKIPGGYFFWQQRYRHKNGNWIWCEGYVTNMMHEPGINALVSNFRDISEKKKTEEQREFDKNNMNALINNTNDLMWSVDRDLKLISFNQPFAEIFNSLKGEAPIAGCSILHTKSSPEKLIRFKQFYERALAGETFTEIEHDETAEQCWTEISYYPICKSGAVIGTACFSRDITKSKLAEETLKNMTIDLDKRIKELEQFAYIVSHNLRAPVANILGAAYILNDPRINIEKRGEINRGLNESVLKLDGVIKDLNNILKVKREISEIKEKVYFSELVENIKVSIKNLIDKDSILIQYDFAEINELITLKNYIYSIFYNLISNSIKYRRQQVPSIIQISSHILNDKITLLFTDNGMGIDLKKSGDQVFGLYKRFHDTVNGKGVGLFMVKTQVETLGGNISIKSEVDKGTTFKIEFKL